MTRADPTQVFERPGNNLSIATPTLERHPRIVKQTDLGYIIPMHINDYMNVPGTDISIESRFPVFCAKIPTLLQSIFCNATYHSCRPMVNQIIQKTDFSLSFLSQGEFETLNGFKALKKQMEWVCGRYMIKKLAKAALKSPLPLTELVVDYQEKGAPFLKSHPRVPLSLSHSGEYTVAGLSLDSDYLLGLDIEAIGPMPDGGFMKTAFTQREIERMAPDPQGVFRSWTLKEAYLKFIGMGFNENLHRVEIIGDEIFHHGQRVPVKIHTQTIGKTYSLGMVMGKRP